MVQGHCKSYSDFTKIAFNYQFKVSGFINHTVRYWIINMPIISCQPGGLMYKKENYGSKSVPIKNLEIESNQIHVKCKLTIHKVYNMQPNHVWQSFILVPWPGLRKTSPSSPSLISKFFVPVMWVLVLFLFWEPQQKFLQGLKVPGRPGRNDEGQTKMTTVPGQPVPDGLFNYNSIFKRHRNQSMMIWLLNLCHENDEKTLLSRSILVLQFHSSDGSFQSDHHIYYIILHNTLDFEFLLYRKLIQKMCLNKNILVNLDSPSALKWAIIHIKCERSRSFEIASHRGPPFNQIAHWWQS